MDQIQRERLRRLQDCLTTISDREVIRYGRFAGDGVRVVRPEELPDAEVMATPEGAIDPFEASQRQYEQIQAEQRRKATNLATSFLTDKKRNEDADQKMADMESRMKAFRKEQSDQRKKRAKELEAKQEK